MGVDVAREALRRAAARDPALDLRLLADGEPLPADASFDVQQQVDASSTFAPWLSEIRAAVGPEGSCWSARRTTGPGGCWRWH